MDSASAAHLDGNIYGDLDRVAGSSLLVHRLSPPKDGRVFVPAKTRPDVGEEALKAVLAGISAIVAVGAMAVAASVPALAGAAGQFTVPLAAFMGALVLVGIVYWLAYSSRETDTTTTLILAGVAAGLGALYALDATGLVDMGPVLQAMRDLGGYLADRYLSDDFWTIKAAENL